MTKATDKNVVESLLIEDEEELETKKEVNTLQDTIKELGRQAFEKHPYENSSLSQDNINGLIRADAFNNYMERNFGYRFACIDTLRTSKPSRALSHNGYGLDKFVELIHAIQASFQQSELPDRMKGFLK